MLLPTALTPSLSPQGVGKTLMAQLIKEALFITDCGVKRIHLDISYKYTDRAGQRERIDSMKRAVVAQLERWADTQRSPRKLQERAVAVCLAGGGVGEVGVGGAPEAVLHHRVGAGGAAGSLCGCGGTGLLGAHQSA